MGSSMINMNEFTFSGELFYKKKLHGEFKYSLKIRGTGQRLGAESSQLAEITCLIPKTMETGKLENLVLYKNVCVSGHIETFCKQKQNRIIENKSMFIVDYVL